MLPDPVERPSITVEEAAVVLGVSRATAYEAVRAGSIPAIRIGRRLVVPTEALLRMLGFDATVVSPPNEVVTTS